MGALLINPDKPAHTQIASADKQDMFIPHLLKLQSTSTQKFKPTQKL